MSNPKTKKKDSTLTAAQPALVASVSRETLEETPARVLSLLRAVGTNRAILASIAAYGYDADDHREGWTLLHAVSGFTEARPLETIDFDVRDAIVTLDKWDEDGFRIVAAALTRRHADQAAFVLEGIGPATGPAAVLGVKTLLARLVALESAPERKATRKADHAALATLAKRGLDAKERARLAGLVARAESVSAGPNASETAARDAREAAYLQALVALRAWFEEWSEIARVAVKRRDHLIRMGLAARKPPTRKGDADDTPEPPHAPQ
ncbi:Hypothetical protein A7982_02075 [Minicystis rosea]|nr:Hypothetical protein A7982_02075 [Minicystis rosea]